MPITPYFGHRKLARRGDGGLDVVDVGGGLHMVKPTRAVIGREPRHMGSRAGPFMFTLHLC
jgi:hypothetical protein